MIEIISLAIFLVGLSGMTAIFLRKIPLLADLPENNSSFEVRDLFSKIKSTAENSSLINGLSFEMVLQKILSKVRVLTLKTENKTSIWLTRLRERSQKKKIAENDKYWEEIKTSLPNKENFNFFKRFKKLHKD